MTYTEEERKAIAREALDWCSENQGTLSAWAKRHGRDLGTVKKWVRQHYPEEAHKYCKPQSPGSPEPVAGFVPVAEGQRHQPGATVFRISYHGAEIETDEQGLRAVLSAALALSRSAR